MPLHIPTFLTRLGSAVVFAIILLGGLLWNDWAFLLLFMLIQFLCIHEYFKLMNRIIPGQKHVFLAQRITQAFSFLFLGLVGLSILEFGPYEVDLWPAAFFFPAVFLILNVFFVQSFWSSTLKAFGAMMYITLPIALMVGMRSMSAVIPLALILMIWTNDTMAYLVGSFIGKKPLSKISPKKTWEGTIGGSLLTIAGAAIWGYYAPWYTMTDWIALALIVSITGNLGDLLESKLKRMADVKDSGSIMPGHGGALDRFDSLLVAIPFAFSYAYLFMPAVPVVIF